MNTTHELIPLDQDLWTVTQPHRFYGIPVGTRMTIVRLQDGALWLHSPIQFNDKLKSALEKIGVVKYLIAPNRYHHMYLESFVEGYPEALVYAAPGLVTKRKDILFHRSLNNNEPQIWSEEIKSISIAGIPMLDEIAFLHIKTKTLILTDLCFNYGSTKTRLLRWYRKLEDCDNKFSFARLIKIGIRDRTALRKSIAAILEWDFDRIIVPHGNVVDTHGKQIFARAFQGLL